MTYVKSGIIGHYVLAFVCLHFALLDTGVLNSLEEIRITQLAAVNLFARVLNPREGSVYIVTHRLTVLLYHNSLVWLDTQDSSSWDRNPPNFTLDLVSYRSALQMTYISSGIIRHYVLAFVCLHFACPDTGVQIMYS